MRQQTLFADMPAKPIRQTKRDEMMAVTVYQPNASLMAVGHQWLYVTRTKLSEVNDLAILAKWPGPHAIKARCERYRDLLLSYGITSYSQLPKNAFVATAKILSRKRIPSRHIEPKFWETITPQLDLIHEIERGMFAYRLEVEAIKPVQYESPWSTFKIYRSILESPA